MSHKALSTAETDRQFDPISLLADIWSWENQPSQSRARRHGGQWLSRITEIHHFLSDDKKCWSIVVALRRIIWRYLLVINSDLVYSYCMTVWHNCERHDIEKCLQICYYSLARTDTFSTFYSKTKLTSWKFKKEKT